MRSTRRNLSRLEGNRRRRVFIGGSYSGSRRNQLTEIAKVVRDCGFIPVVADEYKLLRDEDIHTETMALLHCCGLAIFELSALSGALMEIERIPDYATRAIVLFYQPNKKAYLPSRMLSTFITDHSDIISLRGYADDRSVSGFVTEWLQEMKVIGYG